ncbi:universal stress protein [Mycobacterium sp. IS-3022]|uniref:universal stress protein n=1 Tax=Mycobacterium sp. IS-3022 TaxID=1772277 RepID=UPI0007416A24|nr:universal stress protein [Mycobacterium sp. IS-3022]KUI03976.1 hypothetical protein AU188_24060 [Mycobacterium sp. IS-3022]
MPTYEKVVVGVHDSASGRRTVELAASLSTETAARLVLVAAYGAGERRPHESGSYLEAGPGPAELALKRALEICEAFGVDNAETHAVAGDPVTVLVNAVREHQAPVLMVGSHGLATLSGRLLGSVPGGVVREAECDVFVVQTTTQRWRVRLRRRPSSYRRTVLVGVHDTP